MGLPPDDFMTIMPSFPSCHEGVRFFIGICKMGLENRRHMVYSKKSEILEDFEWKSMN
jgi:hypothetical protein